MAEASARISIDELLEHSGWVDRLARQLLGNRDGAEDLVQEAWLAAIERPPQNRRSLTGWFHTLMRRSAARRRAAEQTRRAHERQASRSGSAHPASDLAVEAEGHRLLVALVLEMPDPYRSTLVLRYFGGLSLTEIARRAGTPAATVRVHHKRALDELRKLLAARGRDDPALWRTNALWTGALVMSGKAKGVLAAGILAALTTLAIWSPWKLFLTDDTRRASTTSIRETDGLEFARADATPAETELAAVRARAAAGLVRPKTLAPTPALFGRVVDPEGRPIGGATVVAYPSVASELVQADSQDRPKGWPRTAKTDAEGTFGIGDLAPYPGIEIVGSADGWQPALQASATPDVPIVLVLGRGVSLRGRVRDLGGAPVTGAKVRAYETSGLAETQRVSVADLEGRYEIRGLGRDSRLFVEVGAPGFAVQWISKLPTPDANGVCAKDFYLGHGAEITVSAIDAESGSPIANARVFAWAFTLAHAMEHEGVQVLDAKHIRMLADVRTGLDGKASISAVPSWGVHPNNVNQQSLTEAGLGGVAVVAEGYAMASKSLEVPDDGAKETLTVRCQRSATLVGRVVDRDGKPIPDAQLWVRATGQVDDAGVPGPIHPDLGTLKTDAAGAYRMRVPSSLTGEVEVSVNAWVSENTGVLFDPGQELTVRVSGTGVVEVPDLVLEYRLGHRVKLMVTDPAGAPVWGARIRLDGLDTMDAFALTNQDGRTTCLLPRDESEDARPEIPMLFVQAKGFAIQKVVLDPLPADEVVVKLKPGTRIVGRVVHPDGAPAAGSRVIAASAEHPIDEVFPPARRTSSEVAVGKGDRVASSVADSSGRFEMRDLPAGALHLLAMLSVDDQDRVAATRADVAAGSEDVVITIPRPQIRPTGRLVVNVRERGTKQPVMRCAITLQNGWRRASPSPSAPGEFVKDGLVSGHWTVTVRAPRYACPGPIDLMIPEDGKAVTLDLELDRGITMRGRLELPEGVTLSSPTFWAVGPGAPAATLSADGGYAIDGLQPGASYEIVLGQQRGADGWEAFVSQANVRIPDPAPGVVERNLVLVVAGKLSVVIRAPRLFDGGRPASDEQWRLALESRVTVRAVDGTWSDEQKALRESSLVWQLPLGLYVVRLEVPGIAPEERTVTVSSQVVYADFEVP